MIMAVETKMCTVLTN